MKKPEIPCHNCTDRVPGCHSTCERYIDFKENGYYKMIYENRRHYYFMENIERERKHKKHVQFLRRDGKKV